MMKDIFQFLQRNLTNQHGTLALRSTNSITKRNLEHFFFHLYITIAKVHLTFLPVFTIP